MYLVGHAQYRLLAYHRSDRRLTIGPKQEDENGNGNKERVEAAGREHDGDSRKSRKGGTRRAARGRGDVVAEGRGELFLAGAGA